METAGGVFRTRIGAAIQLTLVLIAIEGALWSRGVTQRYWFLAALAVIGLIVLISRPRAQDLGVGLQGIKQTSWIIPLALVVCSAFVVASVMFGTFGPLYGNMPVSWHAIFYAIWALEQQFILNAIFYRGFENLFGNGNLAVVITAALFALVHIPNPVLMPATFLGGLLFVEAFRRWRNIYPLAIAHAIFGLTLAVTFPDHWIRHMRVGLGFLTFHARG